MQKMPITNTLSWSNLPIPPWRLSPITSNMQTRTTPPQPHSNQPSSFHTTRGLSLYRSLARKDIRTRNSISAYPQIKKMAHKRALNVWNHENQRKFFFKDFFIFLVKRLCVKPTKTDKKERLKKDAH